MKLLVTLTVKFCSFHSQSEVKFAIKLFYICAAHGANFTLATAKTSLLATSLATGELSSLIGIQSTTYQITTLFAGAIYILSDFFTPNVSYHSGKFLGCMFALSTAGP